MPIRTQGCPGFKILSDGGYMKNGARPNWTTAICQHNPCHTHSEYSFAIMRAIKEGKFPNQIWKNAHPVNSPVQPDENPIIRGNCCGYKLVKRYFATPNRSYIQPGIDVDPISLIPYTEICEHSEVECEVNTPERYAFIKLIAMGLMDEAVLKAIDEEGWGKRLDAAQAKGEDLYLHLLSPYGYNSNITDYMWNPHHATEWYSNIRNVFRKQDDAEAGPSKKKKSMTAAGPSNGKISKKRNPSNKAGPSKIKTNSKRKDEPDRSNELKCWFRNYKGTLNINVKYENNYLRFPMDKVPFVIEKLTKFWITTRQDYDLLNHVMTSSQELYRQTQREDEILSFFEHDKN